MAKLEHVSETSQRVVHFGDLDAGEVFKLDPFDGLIMKLQSDHHETFIESHDRRPFVYKKKFYRNGSGPRNPGGCNAVYLTDIVNLGFLVEINPNKVVIPSKKITLNSEF